MRSDIFIVGEWRAVRRYYGAIFGHLSMEEDPADIGEKRGVCHMEIIPRMLESGRRWSLTLILSFREAGDIINIAHGQDDIIRVGLSTSASGEVMFSKQSGWSWNLGESNIDHEISW